MRKEINNGITALDKQSFIIRFSTYYMLWLAVVFFIVTAVDHWIYEVSSLYFAIVWFAISNIMALVSTLAGMGDKMWLFTDEDMKVVGQFCPECNFGMMNLSCDKCKKDYKYEEIRTVKKETPNSFNFDKDAWDF